MNTKLILTLIGLALIGSGLTSTVFAQEAVADIPIEISGSELLIVVVGALGGLTVAYLGYREARSKDPKITFSGTRFADRVILATLVSIPLAIGAASDLVAINLFTLWMVYGTSLGTAEVIMRLRNKNQPATSG